MESKAAGLRAGAAEGGLEQLSERVANLEAANYTAINSNHTAITTSSHAKLEAAAPPPSLVELCLNNNDLENFFSLIAQQLGYKPRMCALAVG